jgi:hypothetical protein
MPVIGFLDAGPADASAHYAAAFRCVAQRNSRTIGLRSGRRSMIAKPYSAVLLVMVLVLVIALGPQADAQTSPAQALITQPINESILTVLCGQYPS